MRSSLVLLAIGVALILFPVAPTYAKWPDQQRREYINSCMRTCQSGDASSIGGCDTFCLCMIGEMEKAYPDPQAYVQLRQAGDPAHTRRIKVLDQNCSSRY